MRSKVCLSNVIPQPTTRRLCVIRSLTEKLAEEIAEIFKGEDRPLTLADLSKMKYADQVIRETIRFILLSLLPII